MCLEVYSSQATMLESLQSIQGIFVSTSIEYTTLVKIRENWTFIEKDSASKG